MKKSELLGILDRYGLAPAKRLGQNFLLDETVADRIVDAASIAAEDNVLEVGPGLGILTGRLLSAASCVTAVEIDAGIVRYLEQRFEKCERLTIVHKDFLKYFPLTGFSRIISNLPYYCSSEILFHIAEHCPGSRLFVLVQKEMAQRISAGPGMKDYGALSVTLGLYYSPKMLFTVDRQCFYPRPEVTSALVSLQPVRELPIEGEKLKFFHLLVKSAFWGRRKTMVTALAETPHLPIDRSSTIAALEEMGLDIRIRGENLSVDEFVELSRRLYKNGK